MRHTYLLPCLAVVLAIACGAGADGRADVESWSYADLDAVLTRFVTADGRVDYDALLDNRAPLDRFVDRLGAVSPETHPELFPSQADRLAYWMNAYNALMLRRVVEAWPVESVRAIRPLYGVFWMERHRLGSHRTTLRSMENKIIRGRFRDPRIHFAINCASTGCPALPNRAWRGETLDDDLDLAARRFINDPRHVRYEAQRNLLQLSKIFDWFEGDFVDWPAGAGPGGALDRFIARYLTSSPAWGEGPAPPIEWIPYDWSINAAVRLSAPE